jgi:hypothetical protein
MKFHPKFFYFKIVLDFIDVYQYHTPKTISPKNSTHNPSFEVYIQIFKLCDGYYFVTNIFHTFKFFNVCWILINNWLHEV